MASQKFCDELDAFELKKEKTLRGLKTRCRRAKTSREALEIIADSFYLIASPFLLSNEQTNEFVFMAKRIVKKEGGWPKLVAADFKKETKTVSSSLEALEILQLSIGRLAMYENNRKEAKYLFSMIKRVLE